MTLRNLATVAVVLGAGCAATAWLLDRSSSSSSARSFWAPCLCCA
jgi:hypothetical protein